MTTLTVTALGQVTFEQGVLEHLGVRPGDEIELELRSEGRAELKAAVGPHAARRLHGCLEGKTNGRRLTLDELNDAIANAGARAGLGSE